MKVMLWIPFACLVGILIGAWGPRGEIRAMKDLAQEAKSRPRNAAAEGFKTFTGLVHIPDEATRPRRRQARAEKPLFVRKGATNVVVEAAQAKKAAAPAATNAEAVAKSASATNAPPRRLSPEDLRARIEEAQDLWRTRAEMARSSWKSRLKLSEEAVERFDAAVDEMNEHLYETMQTLAQLVSEKGKVTPELGLRLVGDATTIMAEAYEKVGACVPQAQRDTVAEMPMTDFIDPGVAEPLIAVQDKFQAFAEQKR